jgi:hypothetical protein
MIRILCFMFIWNQYPARSTALKASKILRDAFLQTVN